MKTYTTLDIFVPMKDGESQKLDTRLWAVKDLIAAKKYKEAEEELEALRAAELSVASEASDENGFHFNKALLACRKPSKTDPTKTYVDFYLQIKKDSSPIAIKISFYNPSIFRFMLANSDKVEAYVNKSVSVKPVKEEGK